MIKDGLAKTGHSLVPAAQGRSRSAVPTTSASIFTTAPTTQDIEDTGGVLEMKEASKIIFRDLLKNGDRPDRPGGTVQGLPHDRTHPQPSMACPSPWA